MFRTLTRTTIKQVPTTAFPKRTKTLYFDFIHEFEAEDSWETLCDTAKIKMPRNIYVKTDNGKAIALFNNNLNIGGFLVGDPLFLRGDQVTIEAGYKYYTTTQPLEISDTSVLFQGFISVVHSKVPIELDCEDNMWNLKQIPAPTKVWDRTMTLESILKTMLQNTPYTVNILSSTIIDFTSQPLKTDKKESVCEFLQRLKKDFFLKAYFRGNELRCGSLIYIDKEAHDQTFTFNQNIISDELEYKRKDDIMLSAVCHNTITQTTGAVTKDGFAKTKKVRIEVLVFFKNGVKGSIIKSPGVDIPPNVEGERREFTFIDAKSTDDLIAKGFDQLQRYYYDGLKGKFTTFGIPFVQQGDNAILVDKFMPERNGKYKIKSVKYTGGINGLRQEVELDYRIK